MRILIAEDDEGIMSMYKLLFSSTGHDLYTANDGEECTRIFDDQHGKQTSEAEKTETQSEKERPPFDLVILDYRMPKKDGIEVANHILSVCPAQRIIIASAYTHELAESYIAGKDRITMLQKPFEFDTLLQLIEGNVTRRGSKHGPKSAHLASDGGAAGGRRHVDGAHTEAALPGRDMYHHDSYFLQER